MSAFFGSSNDRSCNIFEGRSVLVISLGKISPSDDEEHSLVFLSGPLA